VEVRAREADVEVRDREGDVMVRTLRGDILLRDLTGAVEAVTVEGDIDAFRLTGRAKLQTGDDDLRVRESSADLDVESVDGEIDLIQVTSRRISARTTEGDINASGRFADHGDVSLFSHGGDIQVELEPPLNLVARVLAYGGEFTSDFRVRTRSIRSGEVLEFTLGDGGGRLTVETFDGSITLLDATRQERRERADEEETRFRGADNGS
jgi:DUF4097 and DUF4098 domain-containing protein YvlB